MSLKLSILVLILTAVLGTTNAESGDAEIGPYMEPEGLSPRAGHLLCGHRLRRVPAFSIRRWMAPAEITVISPLNAVETNSFTAA